MSDIHFINVNKTYGNDTRRVINGVNLRVEPGEFCVFVGPSGCGKSTLLRMVAGLEDISQGEIHIAGTMVNDLPPSERGVAMVFQNYALYPHMTVAQNMAFALTLARHGKAEIEEKVQQAATILQLEKLLHRYPKQLSGGQRQRVAIGRAIVRQPNVFLFDEPLSNLDAALRVQTRIEIARLHREFGKASVIYVTHDQVEAMTMADKIVLLNTGEATDKYGSVAQVGAPLELYHRPRNRFVAGFIGSPNMNFLPGTLLRSGSDESSIRLKTGDQLVAKALPRAGGLDGSAVTVGIRPEHIHLGVLTSTIQGIVGQVVYAEYLGENSYVHVRLPTGETILAKEEGTANARTGDQVKLLFNAAHIHVFDKADQAFTRTEVSARNFVPRETHRG